MQENAQEGALGRKVRLEGLDPSGLERPVSVSC